MLVVGYEGLKEAKKPAKIKVLSPVCGDYITLYYPGRKNKNIAFYDSNFFIHADNTISYIILKADRQSSVHCIILAKDNIEIIIIKKIA